MCNLSHSRQFLFCVFKKKKKGFDNPYFDNVMTDLHCIGVFSFAYLQSRTLKCTRGFFSALSMPARVCLKKCDFPFYMGTF